MTPEASDETWMKAAIALGARGLGRTWPNPSVGCILVKNGRVVGRGHTQDGGRPHGETMALAAAGADAQGATAYVSLEPCAHDGRTPPCAHALVKAGVARVVIGSRDPDPRVNGKGVGILTKAGITVVSDICRAEADHAHRGFLTRIKQGRPHVLLKLATTLDGKIAMASGESRWITGPAARRHVHALRSRSDAILVGRGTAVADDPMLDVRDMGTVPNPVRVVLDREAALPATARLASTARDRPTWVYHAGSAPEGRIATLSACGVRMQKVALEGDRLDIHAVLADLAAQGITRLMVEGGAAVAAAFIGNDLVDELVVFSAGKLLGRDALASVGDFGLAALADAPHYRMTRVEACGADICSYWQRP